MVAAKAKSVRRAGLLANICIGETESQRTAGKHLTTLGRISLPEDVATDAAWQKCLCWNTRKLKP